jgi:hypothetical protein
MGRMKGVHPTTLWVNYEMRETNGEHPCSPFPFLELFTPLKRLNTHNAFHTAQFK